MDGLKVVCFWWFDPQAAHEPRRQYKNHHVTIMRNMVARHLAASHEFVCVTNRANELSESGIRTVPLDITTFLPRTRYAKLMLFRRDIGNIIGKRILYIDLDAVVIGQLDLILKRDEEIVIMHNANYGIQKRTRFNTGMMLLRAGVRPDIYEDFDPLVSPQRMNDKYGHTTDQAWITDHVELSNPYWDQRDGVYDAMRMGNGTAGTQTKLPDNAKIVLFPGKREPGMAETQKMFPWIKEHWH